MTKYMIRNTSEDTTGPLGIIPGYGAVFCDRASTPLEGISLYKIRHQGIGKNSKPYTIVEPVMYIGAASFLFQYLLDGKTSDTDMYLKRISLHFKKEIKSVEDLMPLVKEHGDDSVYDVAVTKIDCTNVDFSVVQLKNIAVKPSHLMIVEYVNGETDWMTAAEVYKNRDRLVNTTITVWGNTADTLRIEFS